MAPQDHHNNNCSATAPAIDDHLSNKKRLISELYQIIENEVVKTESQIDFDLIMECSEFIEELTNDKVWHTYEELQEKLKTIK